MGAARALPTRSIGGRQQRTAAEARASSTSSSLTKAAISPHCISPLLPPYAPRESGGRCRRQPGQVRKEAAVTIFVSGRPGSHLSPSNPFPYALAMRHTRAMVFAYVRSPHAAARLAHHRHASAASPSRGRRVTDASVARVGRVTGAGSSRGCRVTGASVVRRWREPVSSEPRSHRDAGKTRQNCQLRQPPVRPAALDTHRGPAKRIAR